VFWRSENLASGPARGSACARRRRNSSQAPATSRPGPIQSRARHSRPQVRPRRLPTIRQGAFQVPRIIGDAIDRVVALPIGQHERHVGLAENHAPAFWPGDRDTVMGRRASAQCPDSPGRRKAGDAKTPPSRSSARRAAGAARARTQVVSVGGGLARPRSKSRTTDGVYLAV